MNKNIDEEENDLAKCSISYRNDPKYSIYDEWEQNFEGPNISYQTVNQSSAYTICSNISPKEEIKSANKKSIRKFRIHKYPNSERDLDVRYDVMNKNFIRAIKREWKKINYQFIKNKENLSQNLSIKMK